MLTKTTNKQSFIFSDGIGVINGCNIAYKYMGKQNGGKGGAVISVSSIAGLLPVPFIPVYAATKAAVIGLTRSYGTQLHYDLTGITFTAVCPGPTNTEIYWSKSESIHFLAEYEKLREKRHHLSDIVQQFSQKKEWNKATNKHCNDLSVFNQIS